MTEVTNLNKARKARAKALRQEKAAASRARSGRTKLERKSDERAEQEATRHIDDHRLERPDQPQDEQD